MENSNKKELLFMLKNGEEFIKADYCIAEEKIYFRGFDEQSIYTNVDDLKENVFHLYEENRIEIEILADEIKSDTTIINRIKSNPSLKLLFLYDNKEYNRLNNF